MNTHQNRYCKENKFRYSKENGMKHINTQTLILNQYFFQLYEKYDLLIFVYIFISKGNR